MSDEDGLLQNDTYDFNIKNTGDSPAKYNLKLINEVPSSYTGKVLDTKYIKVGLEINGEEYGPMSLEKVKNIIDSDVIYKRELINFKLRIWLDSSKEKEIESLENYKAFLKLKVEAIQRPESMDNGVNTKTFNYTGKVQEYTVPRDGYYYIEMAGASGGTVPTNYEGGLGAKTSGYVKLNAGEKLYFYVGGAGTSGKAATIATYQGGYNGGGNGYVSRANYTQTAASGGGATDVRLVGGNWDDTKSLISRIMVAGGGGGAYSEYVSTSDTAYVYGGAGGALYGNTPIYSSYSGYSSLNPTGGTQKDGGKGLNAWTATSYVTDYTGSFGKGATGGNSYSGGGGGYYGGASGVWQPGAGGSSYISGYAGVNSVKESTTITHTNQTLHYSGIYFLGGQMLEGQNSGNGYAKISFVDTKPKKRNQKLNNVRYIKDCENYSSASNGNHWVEIQAIKDGINVAKDKTSTGTTSEHSSYPYIRITDGDIDYTKYGEPATVSTNQCITVDLEQTYDLDEVAIWNYFGDTRAYYKSETYVSSDNKNFTKVLNEATIQNSNGRRINAYTNTINGYTQDNLKLWYDGYANSGSGHATSLSTWKDLSGSGYNGTISSGTWKPNYLLLPNTTVTSSMNLSTALPSTSDSTLSISIKVNSVPYTNSTYGNTGVLIGAAYYNGMGISWYKYPTHTGNNFMILGYTRTSSATEAGNITYTYPTSIMNLTYVNDGTNKKVYLYINGEKVGESNSVSGSYTYASNMGNLGINKAQIYGGNSATSAANINVYSAKVYTKALTQEEIIHNYNYDKQKFNLEQ